MPRGSTEDLTALDERVKALVAMRPSHAELLEFCGALLKEQLKARKRLHGEAFSADIEGEFQEGETPPLLFGKEIPLELESAKGLFRSLRGLAKKQNRVLRKSVDEIDKAMRTRRIDLGRLLGEMTLSQTPYTDEVSSSLGLSRDVLVFLARASIQPFMEELALHLAAGQDHRDWRKGICPICGSPPIMSELSGEEGRRMWICSLCGYRWRGLRLGCPFCGREDPQAHRYLFVEGDDTVRVDVCDECGRYIKTLDSSKMDRKVFPLLEYVGTLHLDVLAQKEGYQRGSTPFLEIG
ncbi:MAG: formate dehydrogenase accessory protein FdhE [Deltaproteobacteria bacterium]|nr:formate dehydrogenase accessory protein FdhE [Deltaproteobacteria bacterium]